MARKEEAQPVDQRMTQRAWHYVESFGTNVALALTNGGIPLLDRHQDTSG